MVEFKLLDPDSGTETTDSRSTAWPPALFQQLAAFQHSVIDLGLDYIGPNANRIGGPIHQTFDQDQIGYV